MSDTKPFYYKVGDGYKFRNRFALKNIKITGERPPSLTFITVYCCNYSIIVNFFLCLIYKSNFIIGVYK